MFCHCCLLKSTKLQFFTELTQYLQSNPKQLWLHFRHLSSKSNKPSGHNIALAAGDINDYFFLSVPYKTVQSVPLISLSYLSTCCKTKFLMVTVEVDEVVSV